MRGLVLLVVVAMTPASVEMAQAQVTVNQRALEQLGGAPPPRPAQHAPAHFHREARHDYHHYARRPLPLPPPFVPAPVPVIAKPPLPLPPNPPAPHTVTRVITFIYPGASPDLPPAAAQQLGRIAATPGIALDRFILAATAPGEADDPSIARRLSLMRALAIQSKLIEAGVPPQQILVQALGAAPNQPDDRVTLTQIMTEP